FVAFRDYHSLTHQNKTFEVALMAGPASFSIAPYPNLPRLFVVHRGAFQHGASWYLNQEYLRELERGLDYCEDLFSPGLIDFELEPQRPAWFIATLEPALLQAEISQ